MEHKSEQRRGFSLVELIVSIAIVVVLVAILMPIVARVRHASRATACLSNLQQWGHAFQMYVNSNKGSSIPRLEMGPDKVYWWQALSSYNSDVRRTLLCPEAAEPRTPGAGKVDGTATHAWRFGNFVGSYGFNAWVFRHPFPNFPGGTASNHIRLAGSRSDIVPLLGDCCWPFDDPSTNDAVPTNLQYPEDGIPKGLAMFCIDRHDLAINIVFLDGHAARVSLAELWVLKWSETSRPRAVSVPKL